MPTEGDFAPTGSSSTSIPRPSPPARVADVGPLSSRQQPFDPNTIEKLRYLGNQIDPFKLRLDLLDEEDIINRL
jgi:hypothetical protein